MTGGMSGLSVECCADLLQPYNSKHHGRELRSPTQCLSGPSPDWPLLYRTFQYTLRFTWSPMSPKTSDFFQDKKPVLQKLLPILQGGEWLSAISSSHFDSPCQCMRCHRTAARLWSASKSQLFVYRLHRDASRSLAFAKVFFSSRREDWHVWWLSTVPWRQCF